MNAPERVLITGGAGFVGTNLASRFLDAGCRVILLDNLSRPGVERNVRWLSERYGSDVDVTVADVRDAQAVRRAVAAASRVYHFAAQVAVTTSLEDPSTDFAVNAQGTLNVLEAIRHQPTPPPLLFTSTNKVYGDLGSHSFTEEESRFVPDDPHIDAHGVGEDQPLDFHSPYGCSKGTADQYVIDYARCFRLPTVVFRMSCIYGPHQCGNEDQGWVAHFLMRALRGESLTIYGNGKQVRDVLYVEDLAAALTVALDRIDSTAGRAFNMGGGPERTTSLLELLELIAKITGKKVDVSYEAWRTGDQRYYVSDTRAFQLVTGWRPQVSVAQGIRNLADWLTKNRASLVSASSSPQSSTIASSTIASSTVASSTVASPTVASSTGATSPAASNGAPAAVSVSR